MTLTAGTKLGLYDILSPLGAGGMGEVYRAKDTRLGRDVAIKVLPEEFFEDEERRLRFEREARTLATLNHPGIAAIYSFEEIPGNSSSSTRHLLVMELVEGEDLAEKLLSGPLSLEESLPIAKQIAEALEAAHEKGIVHRDLKPANVKVTEDGKVKLLDFGLAKAFAAEGESSKGGSGGGVTQSPTLTARATAAGVILGTAAYMSPEQARGKALDKRTDVWSFGCVLYEMLTGKRAFEGETVSDTLVSVLSKEPDWSALRAPGVSSKVVELLRRCLQRDVKQRLRDIGDARIALEEEMGAAASSSGQLPFEEIQAAPNPTVARSASATRERGSRKSLHLSWALAAAFAVAALALGVLALRPRVPQASRQTVRFVLTPPPGGSFSSWPALTADGTTILYSVQGAGGTNFLWTRRLDSVEAKPLPVELPAFRFPFWSPDGRSIAYGAGEKLVRLDLAAARPQSLCPATLAFHGCWGSKGDLLFVPYYGAPIHRVSSEGGASAPVTTVDGAREETAHLSPSFLPDGRRFLFFARLKHEGQSREGWICAASLDGKEVRRIRQADAFVGVSDHALYFTVEGTLFSQAFDEKSLATRGEPVAIPGRVLQEGDSATSNASVARDGTLVFRSDPPRLRRIVAVDRTGRRLRSIGAPGEYIEPLRLSPDGSRIAVARLDERTALGALWLVDVAEGAAIRLTTGRLEERFPVFSPDGKSLAFGWDREGPYDIVIRSLEGGTPDRPFAVSPLDKLLFDWTREGELLYLRNDPKESRFVLHPMESGATPRSIGTAPTDGEGSVSPDGKWLAFTLTETGRSEVYVKRATEEAAKVRVSLEGGRFPRWRGDSKEIFFVGRDQRLMAVPWDPAAPVRRPAEPLFAVSPAWKEWAPYDVSADGRTFYLLEPVDSAIRTEITVVVNGAPNP
jgi:serine/threonine protein kinase/Tol biopolymer transport system component